jgi:ABC-2 type transport system permease protein
MNIYIRELKAHRKSIIIWSIAMILFVIMGMQKFSTLVGGNGGSDEMMKLIDSMPSFLKAMWGVSSFDLTKATGYFGVLFSYLVLMSGVHASMLGSSIIYKEERDKTVEFLMVKPVSRKTIVTSKMLASLTNIVIFNLVTFITSIFVLKGFTNEPIFSIIILSMIAMFFIQIIFLVMGSCAALIMKKPKRAGMITLFILIGAFFLSLIIDMSDKLEILKVLTPFKYFDAKEFFMSKQLSISFIVFTLIISTILMIKSYKQYEKRDLNI